MTAGRVRPSSVPHQDQELYPLPADEKTCQEDQKRLWHRVAGEAPDERAHEGRDPHHEHDALVDPPLAQVSYRAGEGAKAADEDVGPAGRRRFDPYEQQRRKPHGAQREPHETAEEADGEGDEGQHQGLPDQYLRREADYVDG